MTDTVTQELDRIISENSGSVRDALNVTLAKLHIAEQTITSLHDELSTCTECKEPVDCGLKAELRKKDAEIERLTARIYTLEDMSSGGKP